MFYVCDCVIVCYTLRGKHIYGMMYMGNVIAWLLRRKSIYMVKCIWEQWNAKVRNHNLRGLERQTECDMCKMLGYVLYKAYTWYIVYGK